MDMDKMQVVLTWDISEGISSQNTAWLRPATSLTVSISPHYLCILKNWYTLVYLYTISILTTLVI